MKILSTTTSIAIGFGCIIVSAVLGAHMAGLVPDASEPLNKQRLALVEVVAAQCSAAADRNDVQSLRSTIDSLIAHNPDVASVGLRAPDGKLVMSAGPHAATWRPISETNDPSLFEVAVPVVQNNREWATVEMRFTSLASASLLDNPLFRITAFVGCAGFFGSLLFLRKALKHLDPSSVIPDRVRAMLDALAEGVIVMDTRQQIVMANEAFCGIAGADLAKIQSRKVSEIPAMAGRISPEQTTALAKAFASVEPIRRMSLSLASPEGKERSLVVNIVPVLGNDGSRRGVLATFDDITSIEATNAQLRTTLTQLAESRDEITRQNRELEALASRDPLTGCFNRRAFMRSFDEMWGKSSSAGTPLACIMLDIDQFKMINDRYGHAVGDQVLKQMGKVLQSACRSVDLICRYGGEEFCMLLPGASFEVAHAAAQRMREAILAAVWPITTVTASLGVTGVEAGAPDSRQLLEQADKALYAAKRTGRNRVIAWGDPAIEAVAAAVPEDSRGAPALAQLKQVSHALFQTLAQRDPATAEHSQRVADFTALMIAPDDPNRESIYLAALLHDMGKVAVPDAILHKAGPLTDEEWTFMRKHENVGADLVSEATNEPQITEIVRAHHAWFNGTPGRPELSTGEKIPSGARCIAIADAYDAMTSDRPYRQAMPHERACAELIRCAGTQFDPALVQVFIARLNDRRGTVLQTSNDLTNAHTHAVAQLLAETVDLSTFVASATNSRTAPLANQSA